MCVKKDKGISMSQKRIADQVTLVPTAKSDLDSILSMEQHPENRLFVRQWTREQHVVALRDENVIHLTVRTSSGDLIGYVILIGIENVDKSVEFKRIVIGVKGKGFGRATVNLVKQMVFEKYNTHRLWLEVMEHNDRAHSLYLSEGFTEEGLHRESFKQGDNFVSFRAMSILKHEYNRNT
jgi:RimJ/RimL family protein N-acetyltransferase